MEGSHYQYAGSDEDLAFLRNEENRGLGFSYRKGVGLAHCDFVCWFPADNDFPVDSMVALFDQVGQADSIIHSTLNPVIQYI